MALFIPQSVGGSGRQAITPPVPGALTERANQAQIPNQNGPTDTVALAATGNAAVETQRPVSRAASTAPQAALVIPDSVSNSQALSRAPEAAIESEPGFLRRVANVFTGADRETKSSRELPELFSSDILDGESRLRKAALLPVLLSTSSPREIGDILANNFPNINISEDEKGNIIAINNKTGKQSVLNKPGLSKTDIIQGLGIAALFTPAGRLASIGTRGLAAGAGILSRGTGRLIAQRGGLGAGLAAATESLLQGAQKGAGGEFDSGSVATAGLLGGLGEAVTPLVQGFRQGRQVSRLGAEGQEIKDVASQVQRATEASEATGIPLFQAQQTNIPAQLEKQAFLPSLPASTQVSSKAISSQNKAAGEAVESLLNQIAPAEAVTIGPGQFRTAAQRAIEKRKIIRAEKSSPLYKEAFKDETGIDVGNISSQIDTTLQSFPSGGEVARNLSRVKTFLQGKTRDELPSIELLHNAKLEIDQMINRVGVDSLGNTTKARLVSVKNDLLGLMDAASPEYAAAREAFKEGTPAVLQLEDSIIGQVANLDDVQLKRVSARIFDPAETNVQVVKNAKKVIDDVDPDAWNLLLRSEVERRLGSIKSTLSEGSLENVPGQLQRAIFGNAKSRAILKAGVDGDLAKNLNYLQEALTRASRGRGVGSQTATREEIKRELRGGIISSLSGFLSPAKSLQGSLRSSTFDSRANTLAEILFDPKWSAKLSELRKLSPDSPAAARALTQLLNSATETEEE